MYKFSANASINLSGMRANIIRKLIEVEPPQVHLNFKFRNQIQPKQEGSNRPGY